MGIALMLLATSLWGLANFVGGVASRRSTVLAVSFVGTAVNCLLVTAIAVLSGQPLVAADAAWAAAAGIGALVGVVSMFRSLVDGRMGVAVPLMAAVAAVIPFTVGLLKGERLSVYDLGGLALVTSAIFLLTKRPRDRRRDSEAEIPTTEHGAIGYALLAGAGFGIAISFLASTSGDSGVWPLAVERGVMTVLLALIVVRRLRSNGASNNAMGVATFSGVAQGTGDVAFIYALYQGPLTTVSALGGLHTATTAVLARLLLKERLGLLHLIGFACAALGVAAFAV